MRATCKVAERLFKIATIGTGRQAVTAAIFWLKCRAGWSDRPAPDGFEPLGKKAAALLAAGQPNPDTPLGQLMLARQARQQAEGGQPN